MLTIIRPHADAECVLCIKSRDCIDVVMDGKETEVALCWACLKKQVNLLDKVNSRSAEKRPFAVAAIQ